MRFTNRKDAAHQLMELVKQYDHEIDIVLAIPRGGVEIGAEIAKTLGRPLELISARKVGAPNNPEVAIGAVAPDGSAFFNKELVDHLNISPDRLNELSLEAANRQQGYRDAFGNEVDLGSLSGKGVLVVDDGAATGSTLFASIEALRRAGAKPVGAAVPVASIEVVSIVEDLADYFLALETPSDFMSVGQYYQDFNDPSDSQVQELLSSTHRQ